MALRGLLAAIEQEYGTEGLTRVRAALPADVRLRLEAPVEPDAQFPIAVPAALHDAIRSELGKGDLAANRRVGEIAARADFGGVFRAFIRVADYGTLLRATERAWQRYNSHGRVEWPFIGKGQATATIKHVKGYTEPMWEGIAGRLEAVLTLGGAKDAKVTVDEWTEHDVRYRLRWI